MADLKVDYTLLDQSETSLSGLVSDFQNIKAQESSYDGALGSGDIAGAYGFLRRELGLPPEEAGGLHAGARHHDQPDEAGVYPDRHQAPADSHYLGVRAALACICRSRLQQSRAQRTQPWRLVPQSG